VHFLKEKGQCEWEHKISTEDLHYLETRSDMELNTMITVQRNYLKDWIFNTCGVII
jgi:hypothetical protein